MTYPYRFISSFHSYQDYWGLYSWIVVFPYERYTTSSLPFLLPLDRDMLDLLHQTLLAIMVDSTMEKIKVDLQIGDRCFRKQQLKPFSVDSFAILSLISFINTPITNWTLDLVAKTLQTWN